MAWGIFKKIKNAFKKVGQGIKKVFQPETIKKILNTGVKLAPIIGAGISTAAGAGPAAGMKVGHVVQGIGNNLGFG